MWYLVVISYICCVNFVLVWVMLIIVRVFSNSFFFLSHLLKFSFLRKIVKPCQYRWYQCLVLWNIYFYMGDVLLVKSGFEGSSHFLCCVLLVFLYSLFSFGSFFGVYGKLNMLCVSRILRRTSLMLVDFLPFGMKS